MLERESTLAVQTYADWPEQSRWPTKLIEAGCKSSTAGAPWGAGVGVGFGVGFGVGVGDGVAVGVGVGVSVGVAVAAAPYLDEDAAGVVAVFDPQATSRLPRNAQHSSIPPNETSLLASKGGRCVYLREKRK